MPKLKIFILIALASILTVVLILSKPDRFFEDKSQQAQSDNQNANTDEGEGADVSDNIEHISKKVIAENLEVPWEIDFLPDGRILVTQRPGILSILGSKRIDIEIDGVVESGEAGLLGMALHPDFSDNHWIYLYSTTKVGNRLVNRVERYVLEDNALSGRKTIVDNIPGEIYHDGGRLAFGPDGYLYITTGDARNSSLAQDTDSLAGKILRVKDDGSIPDDNPFGNAVYSYGHRNPQGLAWDDKGRLWATEHGRSGVQSGLDELNLIESGKNYGWPIIQGDEKHDGMESPKAQSGASTTWAPAGLAFWQNELFFGGLKGESLYEAKIGKDDLSIISHFSKEFGRIRAVKVSPDNKNLYIGTSNLDGRGKDQKGGDKLIMISSQDLAQD